MSPSSRHSDHERTPADLISAILATLAALTQQFASHEHEGWQWMIQHSSTPVIAEVLHALTTTAARVITTIGMMEPINGITISDHSGIPKGTVSKITRQLLAKQVIQAETHPPNKKEIYFRLTPLGKELVQVHRAFDEIMGRGFTRFLQQYTPSELAMLERILHDAAQASFLTLGQEP